MLFAGCNKGFTTQNPEGYDTRDNTITSSGRFSARKLHHRQHHNYNLRLNFSSAKKVADESLNMALLIRRRNDSDTSGKTMIRFITDNSLKDEGYEIHISEEGIRLSSKTARGAFYAARSLSQMIWQVSPGDKQ